MTIEMIREAIQELMGWIQAMKQSLSRADNNAADKTLAELNKLGITTVGTKITSFGTVPTLPGSQHVERSYIVDLNKVRDAFLKDYNTFLRKRGKQPVRIAA